MGKKPAPAENVSFFSVRMSTLAFLEGGTFISARRLRMARTASIRLSICASSAAKCSSSLYSGHADTITDGPSCGSACQMVSVMNGMNGCSSCIAPLRT